MNLHMRRHISYPLNPVPACSVCINTDEVLRSFVVLCAPQADKHKNYLNSNPRYQRDSMNCDLCYLRTPLFKKSIRGKMCIQQKTLGYI